MTPTGLARKGWLDLAAITSLQAILVWAPLAAGAYRGWPLAIAQILTVSALACWVLGMTGERRLEWRRTALDLPLGLLAALVLVQLAIGHGPLMTWAVGPPRTTPVPSHVSPVAASHVPAMVTPSEAPTAETLASAPTESAPICITAPVPAWAIPTGWIPAVVAPAIEILDVLGHAEGINYCLNACRRGEHHRAGVIYQ